MKNIFWAISGIFCCGVLLFSGAIFKEHEGEINRYHDFLKAPKEFSAQNILNTSDYKPESAEITEGQILFFLNVAEEMNEASRDVFLKNLQLRSENHFADNDFLKSVRQDAQGEAFGILRARLNAAYMSLDEYTYIRNRVVAGLEIPKHKNFKAVSAIKSSIAHDIFTLHESQNSFKRIVESTKVIQLQEGEKNLIKDFKSRLLPNLLPVLAGIDIRKAEGGNRESGTELALRN